MPLFLRFRFVIFASSASSTAEQSVAVTSEVARMAVSTAWVRSQMSMVALTVCCSFSGSGVGSGVSA